MGHDWSSPLVRLRTRAFLVGVQMAATHQQQTRARQQQQRATAIEKQGSGGDQAKVDVLGRLDSGSTGRPDGDGGWGFASVERGARIFRRQAQAVEGSADRQPVLCETDGVEQCSPSIKDHETGNTRQPNRLVGADKVGEMEEQKGLTSVPKARVACRMCLSTVQCACDGAPR